MFDQRRTDRQEYSGEKVEYSLDPFSKGGTFEASLINISETGICFLSSTPLAVGQQITIHNFMSMTSQTALVMWVERCDEAALFGQPEAVVYKIGVRFMGDNETVWEERP